MKTLSWVGRYRQSFGRTLKSPPRIRVRALSIFPIEATYASELSRPSSVSSFFALFAIVRAFLLAPQSAVFSRH